MLFSSSGVNIFDSECALSHYIFLDCPSFSTFLEIWKLYLVFVTWDIEKYCPLDDYVPGWVTSKSESFIFSLSIYESSEPQLQSSYAWDKSCPPRKWEHLGGGPSTHGPAIYTEEYVQYGAGNRNTNYFHWNYAQCFLPSPSLQTR